MALRIRQADGREPDLLTPAEAARAFGVRPRTVAEWAREGRLTYSVTPGGHRRYPVTAVRQLRDGGTR